MLSARPDAPGSGVRISVDLAAHQVEAIARRAAEILRTAGPAEPSRPYMTVVEAAGYLRCSRQRVYEKPRLSGAFVRRAREDSNL